jgi:hypothetical protein
MAVDVKGLPAVEVDIWLNGECVFGRFVMQIQGLAVSSTSVVATGTFAAQYLTAGVYTATNAKMSGSYGGHQYIYNIIYVWDWSLR